MPQFVLNGIDFTSAAGAYILSRSGSNTVQFAGTTPRFTQDSSSNIMCSIPLDFAVMTTFDGSGSGDLTFSQQLTGSAGFTKASADRLVLTAASGNDLGSVGGVKINAGILEMKNIGALGFSTNNGCAVSVNNATWRFNVSGGGSRTSASSAGISLNNGIIEHSNDAAAGTLNLNASAASPGSLTVQGNSTIQNLETSKSGDNLLLNYAVSIQSGGTLNLASSSSGSNVTLGGSGTDISIAAGGTLASNHDSTGISTGAISLGTAALSKRIVGTGTSSADARFTVGDATHAGNTFVQNVAYVVNGAATGGLRVEARDDVLFSSTSNNNLLGSSGSRVTGLTGSGGTFTVAWKDSATRSFDYAPSSASSVKLGIDAADGSSPVITIGTTTNRLANWAGLVVKGGIVKLGASQNLDADPGKTFDLLGGTFDLTAGNLSVSGAATLATGSITTPTSGNITAQSFTKSTTGAVTVGAGVTLVPTGATDTTIGAGKLLIDGTLASGGGGTVTITGATLGGNGSIQHDVHVGAGATLAPGESIGMLAVGGNVTFDASSVFAVELAGGASSDSLAVTGNVSLNGATLSLIPQTAAFDGSAYTILTYTGTRTGTFAMPNNLGTDYGIIYNDAAKSVLLEIARTPEPGALALLTTIGMLMTSARQRHPRWLSCSIIGA